MSVADCSAAAQKALGKDEASLNGQEIKVEIVPDVASGAAGLTGVGKVPPAIQGVIPRVNVGGGGGDANWGAAGDQAGGNRRQDAGMGRNGNGGGNNTKSNIGKNDNNGNMGGNNMRNTGGSMMGGMLRGGVPMMGGMPMNPMMAGEDHPAPCVPEMSLKAINVVKMFRLPPHHQACRVFPPYSNPLISSVPCFSSLLLSLPFVSSSPFFPSLSPRDVGLCLHSCWCRDDGDDADDGNDGNGWNARRNDGHGRHGWGWRGWGQA